MEHAPLSVPDPAVAQPAPARARILVCDDSSTMRSLMRSLLSPTCELLLTSSGEELLARAPEFRPDVVICDLLMPGISGAEVCRRLRADPELGEVPFVLVTTLADSDARADCLEAGADDYLYKPIRERELLARVVSLVRLRRAMLAAAERLAALQAANAALREAQGALVRAEKLASVGALAAGLSHEINNPLSYIKSGTSELAVHLDDIARAAFEALDRAAAPEPLRERLTRALAEASEIAGEVADGSRRLQRVAADLRVFTGPASSLEELVDPAEALQSAWTLARSKLPALPRLELALEPGAPLVASRALVTQPLVAVLENAIFATAAGGLVSVRLRQIPGGVEIAVRDSGPGIPPELLPLVFDPFFTARSPAGSPAPGLSVAYGIVHGLGGAISVESPPGEGATFRLRFPRRPGAFAAGGAAPEMHDGRDADRAPPVAS